VVDHPLRRLARLPSGGFEIRAAGQPAIRVDPSGSGWRVDGVEGKRGWSLRRADTYEGGFVLQAFDGRTEAGRTMPLVGGGREAGLKFLLLDDGRLLHITAHSTPRIGPPTEQQIGARCPVCRTPITKENARVFTCTCGSVSHYDDPTDTTNDNCLECATIPSECLACHHPIRLVGGFEYVPDVD